MRYVSTRDSSVVATFEEALCTGYAPDGGLYVPEKLPTITAERLQEFSTLSYPDLSFAVLRLFIDPVEVPDQDLRGICTAAFSGFDNSNNAVPVVPIGPIYVAELFWGPTFCFKDLGMLAVVHLLSYFCTKRDRRITLLVSTTGDTGPAAVQAVSAINNPLLTILVHYPHNQISEFQRRQLTTCTSPCVRVVAFEGGGDDMDRPIKNILSSQERKKSTTTRDDGDNNVTNGNKQQDQYEQVHWMTGVNSYNIGRPLMQSVHYIWTYLRLAEKHKIAAGDASFRPDVILPCGAHGNVVGGYMAKRAGVPLGRLVAACNVNDITHRTFQHGDFSKSPAMHKTLSDAINVQVPYNFERLLFYLEGENNEAVAAHYREMERSNKLKLPANIIQQLHDEFASARVTDEEMCETMRNVKAKYDYFIDPHTAVAFSAADQLGYVSLSSEKKDGTNKKVDEDKNPPEKKQKTDKEERTTATALLSTASPCKFRESVTAALGEEGWNEYVDKGLFPVKAKVYLDKPEVPPTMYKAQPEKTLAETQLVWEEKALGLIAELKSFSSASSKE